MPSLLSNFALLWTWNSVEFMIHKAFLELFLDRCKPICDWLLRTIQLSKKPLGTQIFALDNGALPKTKHTDN